MTGGIFENYVHGWFGFGICGMAYSTYNNKPRCQLATASIWVIGIDQSSWLLCIFKLFQWKFGCHSDWRIPWLLVVLQWLLCIGLCACMLYQYLGHPMQILNIKDKHVVWGASSVIVVTYMFLLKCSMV